MSDFQILKRIGFVIIIIAIVSFGINRCSEATHIKDATIVYEEFQSIYDTTIKLNEDLCSITEVDENDKMFEQISKQQRITALKSNLNRWINEYNAKSKMFGRQLWKSNELPYQLSVQDFNCYN